MLKKSKYFICLSNLNRVGILFAFNLIFLNNFVYTISSKNKETTSLNLNKPIKIRRDIAYYHANGLLNKVDVDASKKNSKYSCRDKEDEGHYEHEECRKYWHCLYVGTIFEYALERKCPVGTMFHPIERVCEISTMLTCKGWKKAIYGKDYDDAILTSTLPTHFLNNNYQNNQVEDNQNKENSQQQETFNSGEILRTFNLMQTQSTINDISSYATISTTSTTTFLDTTTTTTMTTVETSTKPMPKSKSKTRTRTTTTTTTRKTTMLSISSSEEKYDTSIETTSIPIENSDKKYSLILSSFLEKLRNLDASALEKQVSSKKVNTDKPTVKDIAAELARKNYTILTSSGKKTILVPIPNEKPRFDLNETIIQRLNYLADIYSKKVNNTNLMNQIEIIKNIFALKNRESTKSSASTSTSSTSKSTSVSPSTTQTYISSSSTNIVSSQLDNDFKSSLVSQDQDDMTKQFETYFDNLETTTVTVKNLKENYDSYYDETEEDSLENEDLSILDSDLLLNLQLNTFTTDANSLKINAKMIGPSQDSLHINGNDEEENEEGTSEATINAVSNQNSLISSASSFSNLPNLFKKIFFAVFYFVFFFCQSSL